MAPKPPAQKSFSVDPGRYKAILAELAQSPDAEDLVVADDQHSGSVSFKSVDFEWRYDGTGSLSVIIVKEHGAKAFLPYQSVFHWLSAHLLTELPAAPVKVEAEPWHEPGSELSSAPADPQTEAPAEPVPA